MEGLGQLFKGCPYRVIRIRYASQDNLRGGHTYRVSYLLYRISAAVTPDRHIIYQARVIRLYQKGLSLIKIRIKTDGIVYGLLRLEIYREI